MNRLGQNSYRFYPWTIHTEVLFVGCVIVSGTSDIEAIVLSFTVSETEISELLLVCTNCFAFQFVVVHCLRGTLCPCTSRKNCVDKKLSLDSFDLFFTDVLPVVVFNQRRKIPTFSSVLIAQFAACVGYYAINLLLFQ